MPKRQRTEYGRQTAENRRHPSETPSGTPSELFHGARRKGQWPRFHSTFDIIHAVEAGRFPDKVMMTVHPQRWTDDPVGWTKELVLQNVKNVVKRLILQKRTKGRKGPRSDV